MRALLLAVTALASLAAPANAAHVAIKYIGRIPTVFINGKIEKGDDQTFNKVAARVPNGKAIVVLTSPGGLMMPGLIIGEAIRARRFATVALDECASTCGLMWLAGVWRGVFEDSAIGFHSTTR
jgi:hypothetical protein